MFLVVGQPFEHAIQDDEIQRPFRKREQVDIRPNERYVSASLLYKPEAHELPSLLDLLDRGYPCVVFHHRLAHRAQTRPEIENVAFRPHAQELVPSRAVEVSQPAAIPPDIRRGTVLNHLPPVAGFHLLDDLLNNWLGQLNFTLVLRRADEIQHTFDDRPLRSALRALDRAVTPVQIQATVGAGKIRRFVRDATALSMSPT